MSLHNRKRAGDLHSAEPEVIVSRKPRPQGKPCAAEPNTQARQSIMANNPYADADVIPLWTARVPIDDVQNRPAAQTLMGLTDNAERERHAGERNASIARGHLRRRSAVGCCLWVGGLCAGFLGAPVVIEMVLCAAGLAALGAALLAATRT